jgi:hypothetical protein
MSTLDTIIAEMDMAATHAQNTGGNLSWKYPREWAHTLRSLRPAPDAAPDPHGGRPMTLAECVEAEQPPIAPGEWHCAGCDTWHRGPKPASPADPVAVSALATCPFCHDPRAHVYYDDIRMFAYVKCMGHFPTATDGCGWMATASKGTPEESRREAINRWNGFAAITAAKAAQPESVEGGTQAVDTLLRMGYTYHGGQLWKPPLGELPVDWANTPARPAESAAPDAVDALPAKWRNDVANIYGYGPSGQAVLACADELTAALAQPKPDGPRVGGESVDWDALRESIPAEVRAPVEKRFADMRAKHAEAPPAAAPTHGEET